MSRPIERYTNANSTVVIVVALVVVLGLFLYFGGGGMHGWGGMMGRHWMGAR